MSDAKVSYKQAMAQGLLTQKEIERLACAALCAYNTGGTSQFDWQTCGYEFSSTKASFSVSFTNTIRKLRENGCTVGGADLCHTSAPSTPAGKKRGRKPKNVGEDSGANDHKRANKGKGTVKVDDSDREDILGEEVKVEDEATDDDF